MQLQQCTPSRALTGTTCSVVPAASPLRIYEGPWWSNSRKDPGSVKWGGGSRGSTEHIAAAMLRVVDPKVNYVAGSRGGGEAVAAITGGNVTVGGSGYSEFAEHRGRQDTAHRRDLQKRLPGVTCQP